MEAKVGPRLPESLACLKPNATALISSHLVPVFVPFLVPRSGLFLLSKFKRRARGTAGTGKRDISCGISAA